MGSVTAPVLNPAVERPVRVSLSAAFQAVLVGGALLLLYWKVVAVLATDWWDESSHGLLIPPLAFYIAWLRRGALLKIPATPDFLGVVFLSFGCALLLVGEFASEFFISRLSLVVVIASILWTFWGRVRVRVLALPLLLLLTMIPVPLLVYNFLALPLQLLASTVATKVAQLAGVAVFQEGNVIHLAQVSLGVAEACSGLRSLGSLLVMGLLIGFLQCKRVRSRLVLVLMAIPIAIGVNVFRVSGTAILADYNYRLSVGFYHTFSGWLVFLAGMALTFGVAKIVQRTE
ncbi:MAG: exosortase [Acidobacteriia bacterium]|nr:exosortase [Terriglobia bacterium]